MSFIKSFEPVIGTNPRILIAGSIPGIVSLQVQQNYAHPPNIILRIARRGAPRGYPKYAGQPQEIERATARDCPYQGLKYAIH